MASFPAIGAAGHPDLSDRGRIVATALERSAGDFQAAYMAAGQSLEMAATRAREAAPVLTDRLAALLADTRHDSQTHAFQLYFTVAGALARLLADSPHPEVRTRCRAHLHKAVLTGQGQRLRAIARAVDVLPLGIAPVTVPSVRPRALPSADIDEMGPQIGIADTRNCRKQGRSLVFPAIGGGYVVLKFAENAGGVYRLGLEAEWMCRLALWRSPSEQRFEVPVPIRFRGSARVRTMVAGRRGAALVFRAPPGYFSYPVAEPPDPVMPWASFSSLMVGNARLMGELMGTGVCHEAPIPLFHNRVQGHRRDDAGRYLWDHGGRLDQWLASCRHPNFGLSGLRDFEHFAPWGQADGCRHQRIGDHLLSLVLVCGAYFRSRAPGRVGADRKGRPVDTRHLFDRTAMGRLIPEMAAAYIAGFAGNGDPIPHPRDTAPLVDRLVAEMGCDRHMEEILRIADQVNMSDPAFRRLLEERGMSAEEAARYVRGAADIRILSGPHLGPFNGVISVPELVDFLAATAALAILERHHRFSGP